MLLLAALASWSSSGCLVHAWDRFDMQVRDPAQVELRRGDRTLVPAGARFAPATVIEDSGVAYQASRPEDE